MPKRHSRRKIELTLASLTDTTTEWYLKYGTPAEVVSAAWREAPRHNKAILDEWLDMLTEGILERGWPPRTEWMMFKSLMSVDGAGLNFTANGQIGHRLFRRMMKVADGVRNRMGQPAHHAWRLFHSRLTITYLP